MRVLAFFTLNFARTTLFFVFVILLGTAPVHHNIDDDALQHAAWVERLASASARAATAIGIEVKVLASLLLQSISDALLEVAFNDSPGDGLKGEALTVRGLNDLLHSGPFSHKVTDYYTQEHLSNEHRVEYHSHEQVECCEIGRASKHLTDDRKVTHVDLVGLIHRPHKVTELLELRAENDVASKRARNNEDEKDDKDVDDILLALVQSLEGQICN